MKWLIRFLGINDKKQVKEAEQVSNYVDEKKYSFHKDMAKIQHQTKKVHEKTRLAHQEAIKLSKTVDDVARKIAVATGGLRR